MEALIDAIGNARAVFLDTAPIIYFIEEHPQFLSVVLPLMRAIARAECRAVSTLITLVEVLTKPLALEQYELAAKYRSLLTSSPGLYLVPLDARIAEDAARIRARHGYRLPDALQLASAVAAGAEAFVTNDVGLKAFKELPVFAVRDFAHPTLF